MVTKFRTNSRCAIWWRNLQPIEVVPLKSILNYSNWKIYSRYGVRGCCTLPFGHLPNTFCFISPSICFISPSNLLRFPKKMLHFPNSLLHFPNKMLHLPISWLHFPMQCCVTLPKNILPNILSFFSSLGLNAISNMSNEHHTSQHLPPK